MKNINDVIQHKEALIFQLEKDVEVLRVAARLLSDDAQVGPSNGAGMSSAAFPLPAASAPVASAPVASTRDAAANATRDVALRQFP
ncbi:MAG TPA: hypothetical protein VG892_09685 [Terriglobales bacterium]|jgi:hypothetical protein|nr:hypothetical protein [Terriglobales bacterium]